MLPNVLRIKIYPLFGRIWSILDNNIDHWYFKMHFILVFSVTENRNRLSQITLSLAPSGLSSRFGKEETSLFLSDKTFIQLS